MSVSRRSGRRPRGNFAQEHLGDMIRRANKHMEQEAAIARLRQREKNLKRRKSSRANRSKSVWYPTRWEKLPGQPGFNRYIYKIMQKAGVLRDGEDVRCDTSVPYDQPYQRTVSYLLHPKSIPNHRMLIAHRTGGGKTLIIIRVFSNFYHDSRPKLAIFPTEDIATNFYTQLMAFDNPYRDYVLAVSDISAEKASSRRLSDKDIEIVKNILELKRGWTRGPNPPAAPLKAVSYNQIGGRGLANNSKRLLQVKGPCPGPPSSHRPNIMCDKIIMMDEAHNLVKPGKELMHLKVSLDNLEHARESLLWAQRSVIGLFTATPMVDAPEDIDMMMHIVKGIGAESKNNEGYISAFYGSPLSAYPNVTPSERSIPKVIRVELGGSPSDPKSALGSYLSRMLKANGDIDPKFMQGKNRWVYDYTPVHNTQQNKGSFQKDLRGPHAREMVPKLWAVAEYIAHASGKVVVLTNRDHGFYALDSLIRNNPAFASLRGKVHPLIGKGVETTRADWKSAVQARGKSEDKIKQEFEADVFGDRMKALVLNAEKFSEGVDFKNVRHVVLLDVPESWAKVLQRVGRAVRHCSAKMLPEDQQTVNTVMFVASLPEYVRWGKTSKLVDLRGVLTMDEMVLLQVIEDRSNIESRMCSMMGDAFDRSILKASNGKDFCGGSNFDDTDYFDEEQHDLVRACHKKHSHCITRAAARLGDHWEGMQQAATLCEKEREQCLYEHNATQDEDKPVSLNCPVGYDEGHCDYYCKDYLGLEGEEAEQCKQRRNVKSSPRNTSPSVSSPKCMSCPMGKSMEECAVHCVNAGLNHIDLYRCMSRRTEGECEHETHVIVPPSTPPPPEGKIRNVDGSLLTVGSAEHRKLVEEGRLPPYNFNDPVDKVYNPETSRLIKRGGPAHKKLCKDNMIRDCEYDPSRVNQNQSPKNSSPKSPLPNNSSPKTPLPKNSSPKKSLSKKTNQRSTTLSVPLSKTFSRTPGSPISTVSKRRRSHRLNASDDSSVYMSAKSPPPMDILKGIFGNVRWFS